VLPAIPLEGEGERGRAGRGGTVVVQRMLKAEYSEWEKLKHAGPCLDFIWGEGVKKVLGLANDRGWVRTVQEAATHRQRGGEKAVKRLTRKTRGTL